MNLQEPKSFSKKKKNVYREVRSQNRWWIPTSKHFEDHHESRAKCCEQHDEPRYHRPLKTHLTSWNQRWLAKLRDTLQNLCARKTITHLAIPPLTSQVQIKTMNETELVIPTSVTRTKDPTILATLVTSWWLELAMSGTEDTCPAQN